ncbi:MAG TPA: nitrous oxide reductase family maturation protein NosD [Kofleriaceae bacterium]|nr:nitrous oxide reductase family maturation protein NosD [Kofleriaceae bacterium]
MRGAVLLAGVALGACSAPARPQPTAAPAGPPAACRTLAAGGDLRALAAVPGARLCLAAGRYAGPIAIAAGAVVWGPREAVLERPAGGTVVELGADAALLGVTVDGRGGVFDRTDAGVRVTGDGARVEGVAVVNAVFGILAERVSRATIRGNRVDGGRAPAISLRGDTIRLWEVADSVIDGNEVDGGRDVVVWYSSGNRVTGNRITGGRYGTHLMYSHANHIAHNRYDGDVVGVFVMYSHDVALDGNLVREAGGAAGMGIGLKDSGNITLTHNALVHDHVGLYLDQAPLQIAHTLTVEDNLFARCDTAVQFHASGHRSRVARNDFLDDAFTVRVEGGGDASDVAWDGNYFDDYAGYDLDGDELGDVPYQLRSLEDDLTAQTPALAFFRGTPALEAADAVTRLVPMYERRTLLTDRAPRMSPHDWTHDWPNDRPNDREDHDAH